jgi:hypothetical protein
MTPGGVLAILVLLIFVALTFLRRKIGRDYDDD